MPTNQQQDKLQPSNALNNILSPRHVTWVMHLFNGNATHQEISNHMHIAFETSRMYQKRIATKLDLPWGQRKIPHIMAHIIKQRLIHWLLLIAIMHSAAIGKTNDFLRSRPSQRTTQRMTKTRRENDNLNTDLTEFA